MCSNPTGPYAVFGHYLLPVYRHSNGPFNLTWNDFRGLYETSSHVEYHHYYGLNSLFLSSPSWHCQQQPMWPAFTRFSPVPAQALPQNGRWPEGATLRAELQWGKVERVFGPHRVLPDFVREDLRRVYGTYPRTDVSITYQGGEYVVRGDPRVGNQEYRVEKKVVRRLESPRDDSMSETVEGRRKKK